MLGAAMPEASVDVDGDAGRPEDEISSPTHASERWTVDSIPEARGVEQSAHGEFGRSIPRTLSLHSHTRSRATRTRSRESAIKRDRPSRTRTCRHKNPSNNYSGEAARRA